MFNEMREAWHSYTVKREREKVKGRDKEQAGWIRGKEVKGKKTDLLYIVLKTGSKKKKSINPKILSKLVKC